MKYMTFNSSCSFAGVANMLESKGLDFQDYEVALGMELPYIVAKCDGGYMAGSMLQEKKYFDIFLKKNGYELVENYVDRQDVIVILNEMDCAMLGIRIDERHKHAVVYKGVNTADNTLVFINNKHEKSDEPDRLELTKDELLQRLDDKVMVASLKEYSGKVDSPVQFMEASISCLDELHGDIVRFCADFQPHESVERTRDTLFRPVLLDSVAMMELLGEKAMAENIKKLQRAYMDAAFKSGAEQVQLCRHIDMLLLEQVIEGWKGLIGTGVRPHVPSLGHGV